MTRDWGETTPVASYHAAKRRGCKENSEMRTEGELGDDQLGQQLAHRLAISQPQRSPDWGDILFCRIQADRGEDRRMQVADVHLVGGFFRARGVGGAVDIALTDR